MQCSFRQPYKVKVGNTAPLIYAYKTLCDNKSWSHWWCTSPVMAFSCAVFITSTISWYPCLSTLECPIFSVCCEYPGVLIKRVRNITKRGYELRQVCPSVHPSVRMELGYQWTDFHEIWYSNIFRKSVEKIQGSLQSDKNKGHPTWRQI